MNPGVRYLLARRGPGALRRVARRLARREGRFALIGVGTLLVLLLSYLLILGRLPEEGTASSFGTARPDPEQMRLYGPPAMLALALVGIRPGAFSFRASEIAFLFAAPISRTQVLAYNLISRLQIVALSAFWAGLFVVRWSPTLVGGFLAMFALLWFNQLTAQLGGLWLASLDPAPAARRRRRAFAAVCVGALACACAIAFGGLSGERSAFALVTDGLAHPVTRFLTAPTRPFIELFIAERVSDLALWGGAAGAIIALEIVALMRLDRRYLEWLVTSGDARPGQRRVKLAARGQAERATSRQRGLRLPMGLFPRWAGAGAISWRQCQELLRDPATLFRGALGIVAVVPIVLMRASSAGFDNAQLATIGVPTALLLIPMLVDGADFRRDLERIAVLRALPVSPRALVLGQLVPTTLLLMLWMGVGSLAIVTLLGQLFTPLTFLLAMVVPPLAFLTAAIDNWVFLLLPYRTRARDAGEATFVGRVTIVMTVKVIAIGIALTCSVVAGTLVWQLVAESLLLLGLVAGATIAACCVPLVLGLARTVRRFDVARFGAD